MRPRDGVPGVPKSHAEKPGRLPHGTEPDRGVSAGALGSRCRAVPGSAPPSPGLNPSSPPPHPPTRCGGAAHGAPGGAHAGGWPARGAGES